MSHPPEDWPPVEVSAYMPSDQYRHVRIIREDGGPIWIPCANREDFLEACREYRPDIDPDNHRNVYWVDHPGHWSGT